MIGKLDSYGIKGNILNWINAFLSVRIQVVKMNGAESTTAPILNGIPQGSVLGPTLFVIYINVLLEDFKSEGLLFADDTKIFNQIKSREDLTSRVDPIGRVDPTWRVDPTGHIDPTGRGRFTRHLAQDVVTEFSPRKMACSDCRKIRKHQTHLTLQQSDQVFEEKDLEIMINSELSFEEHISLKVRKANALIGEIRRSLFKRLCVTFILPNLEYAQVVWAPHLMKYINMIENVQIRATKLVDGLKDLDYSDRLKILDLPTQPIRIP